MPRRACLPVAESGVSADRTWSPGRAAARWQIPGQDPDQWQNGAASGDLIRLNPGTTLGRVTKPQPAQTPAQTYALCAPTTADSSRSRAVHLAARAEIGAVPERAECPDLNGPLPEQLQVSMRAERRIFRLHWIRGRCRA